MRLRVRAPQIIMSSITPHNLFIRQQIALGNLEWCSLYKKNQQRQSLMTLDKIETENILIFLPDILITSLPATLESETPTLFLPSSLHVQLIQSFNTQGRWLVILIIGHSHPGPCVSATPPIDLHPGPLLFCLVTLCLCLHSPSCIWLIFGSIMVCCLPGGGVDVLLCGGKVGCASSMSKSRIHFCTASVILIQFLTCVVSALIRQSQF